MPLQIANPNVVRKVEALADALGLTKTAAVERAVDRLLLESGKETANDAGRVAAILRQLDRIPDRQGVEDPMAWDAHGLPK